MINYFGSVSSVSPGEWLQLASRRVLTADEDWLRKTWHVSDKIIGVRSQILGRKPVDLRVALGLADALVYMVARGSEESLLDTALICAAMVMDRDVSGSFAIVGMKILLWPPLARAETFALVCNALEKVPAGG
jgi:hypothetical protein